jgi:hypothetical protein
VGPHILLRDIVRAPTPRLEVAQNFPLLCREPVVKSFVSMVHFILPRYGPGPPVA